MLQLTTTVSFDKVHTFFSNKIKGHVILRRTDVGYLLRCEPTPAYLAWITHIHHHGYDIVYIQDMPVYIRACPQSHL